MSAEFVSSGVVVEVNDHASACLRPSGDRLRYFWSSAMLRADGFVDDRWPARGYCLTANPFSFGRSCQRRDPADYYLHHEPPYPTCSLLVPACGRTPAYLAPSVRGWFSTPTDWLYYPIAQLVKVTDSAAYFELNVGVELLF